MFKISIAKKEKGIYCCAYCCNNKANKKLGGLCGKHYKRKCRELDPVGIRYNQMKGKAKARNKEFTITILEFRNFCKHTGYIIKPGKRGKNATVDRRCNLHGYHIWNIQLLTLRQNASKGNKFNGDNFDPPF